MGTIFESLVQIVRVKLFTRESNNSIVFVDQLL